MHSLLVCSSSCQLVQYLCRKAASPCTVHTVVCEAPIALARQLFHLREWSAKGLGRRIYNILLNRLVNFHLNIKSRRNTKKNQYFTAYDLNQKWTSNLRNAEEKRQILLEALALKGSTYLFFNFIWSVVPSSKQSLSRLISRFEAIFMGIDFPLWNAKWISCFYKLA